MKKIAEILRQYVMETTSFLRSFMPLNIMNHRFLTKMLTFLIFGWKTCNFWKKCHFVASPWKSIFQKQHVCIYGRRFIVWIYSSARKSSFYYFWYGAFLEIAAEGGWSGPLLQMVQIYTFSKTVNMHDFIIKQYVYAFFLYCFGH